MSRSGGRTTIRTLSRLCCPGHFRSETRLTASFGVRADHQPCQNGLVRKLRNGSWELTDQGRTHLDDLDIDQVLDDGDCVIKEMCAHLDGDTNVDAGGLRRNPNTSGTVHRTEPDLGL